MTKARLLTGATGFVGGAIALELIRETAEPIFCVVRPGRDGTTPAERLRLALERVCREYDEMALLPLALDRCRAVSGDLILPHCGVDVEALPDIGEIWHAAASLAFEDEREEEIARANVGGTEGALALAGRLGVDAFNHISTAYVGGARGGTFVEQVPPADSPSNNTYERTKLAAEHLVASSDLPRWRIFRPSIVIGHSGTHAATAFTGLYGFVRNLLVLRERVSEVLGDMLMHRPLRLTADGGVPINVIPVDLVARSAVRISLSASDAQIFHLTNSQAPQLGEGLAVIADLVGIKPPRYVSSPDELTAIDRQVDEKLVFYGSYIRQRLEFDRSNSDAVLGPDSGAFPMNAETVAEFVSWYLEYLARQKQGKAAGRAVA
jgi:nucleoside-diphosphate-sugar epimerase